jgi:hypothetical protein
MMDIEIWFDEIDDDEYIEYPILPCLDSIWSPPGGRK